MSASRILSPYMILKDLCNEIDTKPLSEISYEMTARIKEKPQQSDFLFLRALFDVISSISFIIRYVKLV